MKLLRHLTASALLVLAATAFAADNHHEHAADKTAQAAKPSADYPLKTCVVSGEELGSMGDAFQYVHKEEGKPDRHVLLCCKMCIAKFKKDPAKFLKKIDDAQAAAAQKH